LILPHFLDNFEDFRHDVRVTQKVLIVLTSAGTEEQAVAIGEELVSRRHAQCVNILPVPRSIYRWKGNICHDSEYLLVIKTSENRFEEVKGTIQELHVYELPEIISFLTHEVEEEFRKWVIQGVSRPVKLSSK